MRKSLLIRILILILALAGILIACRREEETTPTPVSSQPPTETAAEEAQSALPTATKEAPPTATKEAPATATPEQYAAISPEDIDWPPQVVASNPAPGQEMPLDGPIAVRFDQPMDAGSVEAAWAIDPAVAGGFEWPQPDMVVFNPSEELKRDQLYRVLVDKSALSRNGLPLEEAVQLNLQTIGNLQVNQVLPADSTRDVQADGAITVVFNRPVVPLVSSGQQAALPQPLTIDPAVEGQGTWVSTSMYRFVPGEEGFAGATTYRVTVDEGLTDVTGAILPSSVTWQFTTESPEVIMIQPPNGATLVPPTRPISITFNMPMDPATTQSAVSLQPAAPVNYAWQDDNRLLILTPQEMFPLETEFDLVVDQSARSANGQASLKNESISRFTTIPFPAVISTIPGRGETADSWQRGINIQFASPMDMSTLEDRIRIEPEPEEVGYNYYQWIDEFNSDNSNFSLYLDLELQRNTDYVVTIPGDAADPYGNTLGEAYTWQFSVPGFSPVASFNLPQPLGQISTSFPTDVEIIHRNVSQLDVALYDLDLPLDLLVNTYLQDEIALPQPARTWTLPVNTPAEEIGITTVSLAGGGVLSPGVYFLTVRAPEIGSDARYWQNQRQLLVVADTNIVVKEMPQEVHVWTTDLESGQPVAGRNLSLYNRLGTELGTAVSDENGFARFDYTPTENYLEGVVVTSNSPGEEGFGVASSNWVGNINPWQMGLNYAYSNPLPLFSYLYTDRPIYRPGDTVYFKGILRENNFGRYAMPDQQTLTLQIGPNFYLPEGGGLEDSITVTVGADGLFSAEYSLPDDITLGSYNIYLQDENIDLSRTFTVAEYRKPEFQVVMQPAQAEAFRGETADVTLEATYFFGGSAADLLVYYSIYQDSYQPYVPGSNYSFGDQAGFFYKDPGLFGGGGGGVFGTWLQGSEGTTDENGRLTITLPANLLEEVEEGSRRVTVEATVNDITNFPVTATSEVLFHSADGYVGIRPAEFMPLAGTEAAVELLTVDWDGEAVGNQNVEVVFYQREWEPSRNSDYGMYLTQWEAIDTEVERVSLTTNALGKAQTSFVPEGGGMYLAVATLSDDAGRTQTSSTSLWVIDQDYAGWRSDPHQRTMDLVPDRSEYQVGETARILVQSPFSEPVQAWLTIERGNLLEQRVVTLDGGSTLLDLPISPNYAPNVFVSVTAIKPVTKADEENPYADIRTGHQRTACATRAVCSKR